MKSGRGGKRVGAGRPIGTTRGRKKTITINIDPANHAWLKDQSLSYSKIINRLLNEKVDTGST